MDVPAPLDRKVGPYPLGAWVALIGGGVALGLVIRARTKNKGTASTTATDANGTSTTSGASSGAGGSTGAVARPGIVPISSGATSTTTTDTGTATNSPTSNLEWGNQAIRYLTSKGNDASVAQAAVERFLAGYGLVLAERRLVSDAISQLGPPPESAPPITSAPEQSTTSDAPTYTAPPAPATINGPGSLVSPDGNLVFVTDGSSIRWVQNGNESKALWLAGARVKSVVNEGQPGAYPEPLYMEPAVIRSLRLIGPPPPGWAGW